MRGLTVEAATWPAVIGFFVGISLVAQAVADATFGWIEAGIIVVMLAVFAILWSRMRVGKRLAKYKAMTAAPKAEPAGTSKTMAGTDEGPAPKPVPGAGGGRSEEHTSELQSLMRISYAVFCLNKKQLQKNTTVKPCSDRQ